MVTCWNPERGSLCEGEEEEEEEDSSLTDRGGKGDTHGCSGAMQSTQTDRNTEKQAA